MAVDQLPPQSAVQSYILKHTTDESPHPAHLQHLALQIKHNLQYQHRWTDLQIHHYSPRSNTDGAQTTGKRKRTPLPRPLISGLPPQRLYVHPDEQIAMLQAAQKQKPGPVSAATGPSSNGEEAQAGADNPNEPEVDTAAVAAELAAMTKVEPEREWVLPTHLKETWSLRRFGNVFDAVGVVPPDVRDDGVEDDLEEDIDETVSPASIAAKINPWREKRRVVLATLDDDSTVVYYIIHDGIVKPRQN